MKILLAVLTSVLMLSACEFQQDPLANASGPVKDGTPPESLKPAPDKPFDKNAMWIDAPNLINGRIDSLVEVRIAGRIMIEGVEFNLSIENLTDFEGATYDAAKGLFSWTPTKVNIHGMIESQLPLRVVMTSVPSAKFPVISREVKVITVMIMNAYTKPIVNSLTIPQASLQAGSNYKILATVEDIDAVTPTEVLLQPRDCSTYSVKSVSHFLRSPQVNKAMSPGKYNISLDLSLSGAEMIPTGRYCLAVAAISKFGVVSEVYKQEFVIEAQLKEPKITIADVVDININDTSRLTFSIFDPNAGGELSILRMTDLRFTLPGSSITCVQNRLVKSQLDCLAQMVTGSAEKVVTTEFEVLNSNPRTGAKLTHRLTVRFNVKAVK